jgi:aryl-alcohol dehydrogenase-like predicted oxidoreductase
LAAFDDATVVVRLTADNVVPDGALIDEILEDFTARDLEYLGCHGPTSGLPYGVSVEVMRLRHLRDSARTTTAPYDREHVTPDIIRKFGGAVFTKHQALNSSRFRCTIDCLDDYLTLQALFADVADPVAQSAISLIARLANLPNQAARTGLVPKLVLGTAQLGLPYGIANRVGQPSSSQSEQLIKTAIIHSVRYLDTARAYGTSEEVIGRCLKTGWHGRVKIITKLAPLAECPPDAPAATVAAFVDASIFKSCAALAVQKIDVVMLHRATHLAAWRGAAMDRLQQLQSLGVIDRIGASVQSPAELEAALSYPVVSVIQMPFNLLDWRWTDMIATIEGVKLTRDLQVHVRSALLQGLMPSANIDQWARANVEHPEVIITWLRNQTIALSRMDIADLCLGYVNSFPWIDGVVVGVETSDQLMSNIEALNRPALKRDQICAIHDQRPRLSEATLNPALWKPSTP